MNSNNNMPFKKRGDPFSSLSSPAREVEEAPVVKEVVKEEPKEEKVVISKPVVKQRIQVVEDANREKYTATMEKTLRRRIKVAAAMEGIQVSSFIEQACLEKLEREGK